jgi:hypothetical protein
MNKWFVEIPSFSDKSFFSLWLPGYRGYQVQTTLLMLLKMYNIILSGRDR